MTLDLLTDRFHRCMRAQETVRQGLIFSQQSEQQVFGLDVRRTELAGLVPRKKDDAPGFLRITFEHILNAPLSSCESRAFLLVSPLLNLIMQSIVQPSEPYHCNSTTGWLCWRVLWFVPLIPNLSSSSHRKRLRRNFF